MTPRWRTVPVDDPGDLLARMPDPAGVAWVRGGDGFVGWGEAARVPLGPGEDRFARAGEAFTALVNSAEVRDDVQVPGSGPVAFASFTFDARTAGSVLIVPRAVLARRDGAAWLTWVGDGTAAPPPLQAVPAPARIRYAGSQVGELAWLETVAAATKAIAAGELDKVVLARDLAVWCEEPLDPRALVRNLSQRFPGCYTFACDGLVGATPELLVRRTHGTVESLCLAGTSRRGADAGEDSALGAALLDSGKNQREHALAVASVRAALAPLTDHLTVEGPALLRLDNVQHLATRLHGRAGGGHSALQLAAALHPTAAVGGTPTAAALEYIRDLEGLDRGRYAAPVGWLDARGDGEFGIALRCALVHHTRARLYAGSGIVAGSLPEAELEETRLKFRAMESALERPARRAAGA